MKQRIPALLLLVGLLVLGSAWGLKQLSHAMGEPSIHAGSAFTPGASATEEGTLTTAVRVEGKDMVQAKAPTEAWKKAYPNAQCSVQEVEVCTSEATSLPSVGSKLGGWAAGGLGGALVLYLLWNWMEESSRRAEAQQQMYYYEP